MASTFPTTLDAWGEVIDTVDDIDAAHVNDLRDAVEKLEAKVGIDSSVVTGSLDYKVNNFFVTGRKLYLYENVAPTGWSIASVTDKVLAVKGGSQAYNVTGGNAAGSWDSADGLTKDAHTHPGPSHTHSLLGSQIGPDHRRVTTPSRITYDTYSGYYCDGYDDGQTVSTGYYVYNLGPSSAASGTGNTGAQSDAGISSDESWRPYAAVGIIITKT